MNISIEIRNTLVLRTSLYSAYLNYFNPLLIECQEHLVFVSILTANKATLST